jgi:methionyl-tRNA synthetase
MPNKAQELWSSLGAPGSVGEMSFDRVEKVDPTGWKVSKGASLFPKTEATTAGAMHQK